MANIQLRPSYWASVSGGKDSLFMLKLILSHPERYRLDGVVHFELEIDFPFIKNVIDYMEAECEKYGIPFVRIKPDKTWEDLYYSTYQKTGNCFGFPTHKAPWCNSQYKLNAKKKLKHYLQSLGYKVVSYIGYCADEVKRFNGRGDNEIYPLVDFGIMEQEIWDWAKSQPIFNNYYIANKRCGCMYCPMASYMEYAYCYKYYHDNFNYMIGKMKETEKIREQELGRPFSVTSSNSKYNADYLEHIVKTKWLKFLEQQEKYQQISIFEGVNYG